MINRIKVRLFLGILFSCFFNSLIAQNSSLEEGDSLFNQQKFTEAYEKYELIFWEGEASQAMLLKMAYIQDGLGNYTDALFFLDKYYQMSADRNVVGKIQELSEANELSGYSYDDVDYFLALLKKYRLHLISLLVAVMLMLIVYIFQKSKGEEKPISAGIIQLIVVCCLLGVVNFEGSPKAVVMSDYTLLRSGPSAGAEPIEVLNKGHKVKVLNRDEVWTQILWDGREVYVRNGKLRVI
ncbi:SH3 domain-containing protein [Ekhidna sp. To15]|uniref:SH3 domain-containing protein n=1 Tax=Ekhidna sp. To15 TaxID=3395267 RepID=UPI003F51B8D8